MEEKNVAKKLTYEELENAAHQLSEQSRQLYTRLQQAELTNVFKRLDYLFKVLEHDTFFDHDFVFKCAKEITNIITIPEESKEENNTENE